MTYAEAVVLVRDRPSEFRAFEAARLAAGDQRIADEVLADAEQAMSAAEKAAIRESKRAIEVRARAAESECYADDGSGKVIDPGRLASVRAEEQQP